MIEQGKLLSLTTILTLLIWWSADSLVTETITVGAMFDVRPTGANPDLIVALPSETPTCLLELTGPRKIIDEIQAKAPLRLRLFVGDRPVGPGTLTLDRDTVKRALVDQRSEFRKLGVSSVQPNSLPLLVDRMVTKEVAITARRLSLAYEVEPQLQRSSVVAHMRQSQLETIPADESLQIEIGPDLERLLKDQPPGKSISVPVTLDPKRFGPGAELTPSAVDVTAAVKSQRVTVQIPTVPILFAVSPANLERAWRPVTREGDPLPLVTQTITVSGSPEDIGKLQRGESRAYGIVQLKAEDFADAKALKLLTPDFRLPKGVELAQEPTPVEFRLIPPSENEAQP